MQQWQKGLLIGIAILTVLALYVVYSKEFKLGLDIKGGTHLVLEAKETKEVPVITQDIMKSAIAVVRARVDQWGVSEPLVQRKGEKQIIIELAGIDDPQRAVQLLGSMAELDFREQKATSVDITKKDWVKTGLTGRMLKKAQAAPKPGGASWEVQIEFDKNGAKLFGELTKRLVQQPLGIFLDNKEISAPVVQQEIPGGNAVITGNFTAQQAQDLAVQLKAGQLPIPLQRVEERTVSPTLGEEAVNSSIIAGIIGLVLVLGFMASFYRFPGLIADLALFIYLAINLAIYKLVPVTLTVPGIAGFILSIGMAVDANILIFERMKEELRLGKSVYNALEAGFKRAFTSIRDSNITTIISCSILFYFGTGMVKGFALTLAIGVITSMLSAITISKTLLNAAITFKPLKNPKMFGVKLKPVIAPKADPTN